MSKARFFQSVLKEVEGSVIDHVYPEFKGPNQMTFEERMGDGKCPDCDCNSWILKSKESCAVREGGKPYCECMECSYMTHL